jgi:hypothetical protein
MFPRPTSLPCLGIPMCVVHPQRFHIGGQLGVFHCFQCIMNLPTPRISEECLVMKVLCIRPASLVTISLAAQLTCIMSSLETFAFFPSMTVFVWSGNAQRGSQISCRKSSCYSSTVTMVHVVCHIAMATWYLWQLPNLEKHNLPKPFAGCYCAAYCLTDTFLQLMTVQTYSSQTLPSIRNRII